MEILRSPLQRDIPQAFIFYDANNGMHIVGAYAQLLRHFARFRRYSLQIVSEHEYKSSSIQEDIQSGYYNISMNGGTYKNLFANITFSYPLEWSKLCIMVPTKDELPHYWYLLWPFDRYIWLLLCLCVPYVAFLMTCLKNPTPRYCQNLLHSLAVVICVSNINMKLVNATLRLQIFYLLLLTMGFIINSYYCTYLTMYTLQSIFQPFPKTVEEILAANLPVLVPSRILEELQNIPYVNLTPLRMVLKEMPGTEMSPMVKNFTRSYAYIVTQNEWIFMEKLQRNLIQPVFQLSEICFGKSFSAYPMQIDSKFAQKLDYFILLVHQSGLWEQWKEEAFMTAIKLKYYHVPRDEYPVNALDIQFFRVGWIVFFIGLALGCLCFAVEVVLQRYKKKD